MIESNGGGAPTAENAALPWKNNYGLTSIYIAADPGYSMVPGNSVGTPQFSIIDPRDMKVLQVQEGWGGDYPSSLYNTAQSNHP